MLFNLFIALTLLFSIALCLLSNKWASGKSCFSLKPKSSKETPLKRNLTYLAFIVFSALVSGIITLLVSLFSS